jgi:hypothetical protein
VVVNLKNVFDANGIASVIRNEFLKSGVGELPLTECWPELWIVDDDDLARAQQLVAEATASAEPTAAPWRCRHCRRGGRRRLHRVLELRYRALGHVEPREVGEPRARLALANDNPAAAASARSR